MKRIHFGGDDARCQVCWFIITGKPWRGFSAPTAALSRSLLALSHPREVPIDVSPLDMHRAAERSVSWWFAQRPVGARWFLSRDLAQDYGGRHPAEDDTVLWFNHDGSSQRVSGAELGSKLRASVEHAEGAPDVE